MLNSHSFISILLILFFVGEAYCNTDESSDSADRPNILFCIADDASYPHMSAYGCQWVETPGFDRVAREGLLFNNAYTPNAKCAPSRACILTGRNSWQLKEAANHWPFFPAEFRSYVEVLKEHGYHVGKTAKGWAPGIALDKNGKPRQLAGTPYNKRRLKPPAKAISSTDYAGNFRDFLEANQNGKPWCFWYGSTEPHRAYEYGAGVAKGKKKLSEIDEVPVFWPDNEKIRNDMLDYAFEIEHFDDHLSQMIKLLEQRKQLDNTLIVVTADNGMPFPRIKGQEYEMSNHLPLAIMWKNGIQRPGREIDDHVSFIDFAPTFLEVVGIPWKTSGMQPSPGRSLTDIFHSEKSGKVTENRNHVLIGKERHDIGRPDDQGYPIRGIVHNGLLYLENFEPDRWPAGDPVTGYLNCDASPTKTEILRLMRSAEDSSYWKLSFGKRAKQELFDIKKDRYCMQNLVGVDEYHTRMLALRSLLFEKLKEQDDPRMFGNGEIFDRYKYADRKTVDFYNRFKKGEKLNAGWVDKNDFETEQVD